MWHEGRQDQQENKWRRGVRGAKSAWWKLEDLGVDRQKIRLRQSALGLKHGEGKHWSPFKWAEQPFRTVMEWKAVRPAPPENNKGSKFNNARKRVISESNTQPSTKVTAGLRAVKRLRETVDLVFALADQEAEEEEEVQPKQKNRRKTQ